MPSFHCAPRYDNYFQVVELSDNINYVFPGISLFPFDAMSRYSVEINPPIIFYNYSIDEIVRLIILL